MEFLCLSDSNFLRMPKPSSMDSIARLIVSANSLCCLPYFEWLRQDLKRNQMAFLALQIIGGHVGLVIVLGFAIFSRKVRRDPTFLNFCITWIFSSIIFSILYVSAFPGDIPRCLLSDQVVSRYWWKHNSKFSRVRVSQHMPGTSCSYKWGSSHDCLLHNGTCYTGTL